MTFKQAVALGGHVRKGEHGSLVVYAKTYQRTEQDDSGEAHTRDVPFLRAYKVFNVEAIDGLPDSFYAKPPPTFENAAARIEHAEAYFRNTGARIITRGAQPLYSQAQDHILMPPFESFFDAERYYSTLAHETVHWTKHPDRLARDFGRKKFGDSGYALEEIVAEMGAAFICEHLEIPPTVKDDHANYIASWILALQNDRTAIFRAASFAQKAVDYLAALQAGASPAAAVTPSAEDGPP